MNTVIELLIDFSVRMNEKMTFAKSMLINTIIHNLNYSASLAIKTFTRKSKLTGEVIDHVLPLNLPNKGDYQFYIVRNPVSKPTYTLIDNSLDWILKGRVVPYLTESTTVDKNKVYLTILD